MADFVKVARAGEIAPGESKAEEAGGKKIAIFNIEGTFYAIDDTCTHRGGPLSEGMVVGAEVTCPWHGAIFDVTSGGVLGPQGLAPVTLDGRGSADFAGVEAGRERRHPVLASGVDGLSQFLQLGSVILVGVGVHGGPVVGVPVGDVGDPLVIGEVLLGVEYQH